MCQLRDKLDAKDDSNEAARYQIRSMKSELDHCKSQIQHQESAIEQRDDELRTTQARINTAINSQAGIKYELKYIDNEICLYEDLNRKHQQSQSQLKKAADYELCRQKELSL